MSMKLITLFLLTFYLTACQDKQAQIEDEKRDALKSMLKQSNNKLLTDEEIRANLRKNGNGNNPPK